MEQLGLCREGLRLNPYHRGSESILDEQFDDWNPEERKLVYDPDIWERANRVEDEMIERIDKKSLLEKILFHKSDKAFLAETRFLLKVIYQDAVNGNANTKGFLTRDNLRRILIEVGFPSESVARFIIKLFDGKLKLEKFHGNFLKHSIIRSTVRNSNRNSNPIDRKERTMPNVKNLKAVDKDELVETADEAGYEIADGTTKVDAAAALIEHIRKLADDDPHLTEKTVAWFNKAELILKGKAKSMEEAEEVLKKMNEQEAAPKKEEKEEKEVTEEKREKKGKEKPAKAEKAAKQPKEKKEKPPKPPKEPKPPKMNRVGSVVAAIKEDKTFKDKAELAASANRVYAKNGGKDNLKESVWATNLALDVLTQFGAVTVSEDGIALA